VGNSLEQALGLVLRIDDADSFLEYISEDDPVTETLIRTVQNAKNWPRHSGIFYLCDALSEFIDQYGRKPTRGEFVAAVIHKLQRKETAHFPERSTFFDRSRAKADPIGELKGKYGLVTGATRGIGRQMALALAEAGINLFLTSRNNDDLRELSKLVEERGAHCSYMPVDLASPQQVTKLGEFLAEEFELAMIFNNAGINQPPGKLPLGGVDANAWLNMYQVNVVAPAILIDAVLPGMKQRGFGRIVNTTSGIKDIPCAYAASKGALDKLTRDYAATLEGTGVTMNVLDPGWVRTELGGDDAPDHVTTTVPGAIVGGFLPDDVNGRWINTQDFKGLTLIEAIKLAPSKASDL